MPVKLPLGDAANQMRQSVSTTDQVDGQLSPMKIKMTVAREEQEQKQAEGRKAVTGISVQQLLLESAIGNGGDATTVEQVQPEVGSLQQRTPQKRLRSIDSSKFNRSARKSKNCATFYFKHLDTDGENQIGGGFSSQNDEGEEDASCNSEEALLANNGVGSGGGYDGEEGEDVVATTDEEEEDEWLYTHNKFNSTVNGEDSSGNAETTMGKCIVPQISISEDSVFEHAGPELGGAQPVKQKVNGHSSSLIQMVSCWLVVNYYYWERC